MKKNHYISLWFFLLGPSYLFGQEPSRFAYLNDMGCMEYVSDEEGNRISDFSHAGYQSGEIPIPEVPTVATLDPIEGDNTANIQAAIDAVGAMPPNENGFKGALQLNAGVYEIHGQLFVNQDGIILRGAGDGEKADENTILKGIGDTPVQRDLIVVGNNGIRDWKKRVPNSTKNVVNLFLPAGSRSIHLETIDGYTIGDEIIVYQPSTEKWLASINYGDTAEDEPWKSGEIDLYYQRKIIDLVPSENKIILNAPIFDHLDNELAQSVVYKLDEPNIRSNLGIENLRIEIETEGP
ncbi:MAG: peptidoglycan-binding protein, partial [Bacteroidota bacterium]